MKRYAFFILLFSFLFMNAFCGKPDIQQLTGRVTFASGDVLVNGKACEFGSIVKAGDTV